MCVEELPIYERLFLPGEGGGGGGYSYISI